jgi:hypothetical protein
MSAPVSDLDPYLRVCCPSLAIPRSSRVCHMQRSGPPIQVLAAMWVLTGSVHRSESDPSHVYYPRVLAGTCRYLQVPTGTCRYLQVPTGTHNIDIIYRSNFYSTMITLVSASVISTSEASPTCGLAASLPFSHLLLALKAAMILLHGMVPGTASV